MKTIEYHSQDKANWGIGPWQSEPDKIQWQDEDTGLPCLIVRNHAGALCGYVGVPEGHPLYGMDYNSCPQNCEEDWCEHRPEARLTVHGGLTFSDACADSGDHARNICHIGDEDYPIWWFGFDCAHFNDYCPCMDLEFMREGTYRDVAYVKDQCAKLAVQLAKMDSK